MAQMTARSVQLGSASALAGSSVPRSGPFTSARSAPRSLVVRAENVRHDFSVWLLDNGVHGMPLEHSQTAVLSTPNVQTLRQLASSISFVPAQDYVEASRHSARTRIRQFRRCACDHDPAPESMLQPFRDLACICLMQAPKDVAMKTVGALAAAQIALMPLAGVHTSPSCCTVKGARNVLPDAILPVNRVSSGLCV
jgi:hypothetical protein